MACVPERRLTLFYLHLMIEVALNAAIIDSFVGMKAPAERIQSIRRTEIKDVGTVGFHDNNIHPKQAVCKAVEISENREFGQIVKG
jgi:hypothetical protein